MKVLELFGVFLTFVFARSETFEEEKYGVKFASDCEVCKIFTQEFEAKLQESSKKHEVVETGYSHTKEKKKTKYVKSELRLIETLDGICESMLRYNIHKERTDSTRFAKGQSQTFKTLEGLVSKGVKVDLGIPQELWDKPSAEITQLKTQCEALLENYEEDIEDWYFNNQEESFADFLCRKRVLKSKKEAKCLTESEVKKKKKKSKGETDNPLPKNTKVEL